MTAHDDPYENAPLDDEALDELLAAADLELLHQVQRWPFHDNNRS